MNRLISRASPQTCERQPACCGIEEAADKSQRLSLIHAVPHGGNLAPLLTTNSESPSVVTPRSVAVEYFEGGLPAPMSHLGDKADFTPSPLMGQAATGAA